MLTCIDVKFIFDSVRLDLSSSVNILQIAGVALRVVFLILAIISPSSSCSSYSWNEWNVRHFFFITKTTQPRPHVFSVTVHYPVAGCISDVISSLNTKLFQIWSSVTGWLLLANQNWRNILNE